jgi:hypothetical protein
VSSLDRVRLPLTILLGALIIGGVIGVVGINMQPEPDDSRLQPINVEAPESTAPAAPPPAPPPAAPTLAPTSVASFTTDVPAPPPATFDPTETTDDDGDGRGRGRGGDDGDRGGDDRSGSNSGPG